MISFSVMLGCFPQGTGTSVKRLEIVRESIKTIHSRRLSLRLKLSKVAVIAIAMAIYVVIG